MRICVLFFTTARTPLTIYRSISLNDASIRTLSIPSITSPQILCASVTPYAIHIESKDDFRIDSYDAFKSSVHTLIRSPLTNGSRPTFLAADSNRYVNLYDIAEKKILRTLVASGDIDRISLYESDVLDEPNAGDQVLAVITRDGVIDLFSRPFSLPETRNGDMKARRKALTRKADASVKLVNDETVKTPFPAFSVCFSGPNLIIVSLEGGVEPVFQKLRWQDEGSGELLFDGTKLVPRARSASAANTVAMNGAKDMGRVHVNEARAVVMNGLADSGSQAAPLEIESDSDLEEEEEDVEEGNTGDERASEAGSTGETDEEMQDADPELENTKARNTSQEADEEPSFADILAARHPETISIMNSLSTDQNALMALSQPKQSMLPSGLSLGTVLTQSLKTNDQSLLETCLHVTDEHVIQNTLLRLDSSLAANLLTKLAERLADRPGRYGHLLTWIQLTMIAHGGAIASQAGVGSKLRTLYQVLNERSKILPSILLLKGKLDMMNAQRSFRAQAEAHRKGIESAGTTLYVEGQEDNWSSDEDLDEVPSSRKVKSKSRPTKDLNELIAGPESSEDEGMPLVNGGFRSDESEEEENSDEETPHELRTNGILDDEAEVSGEEDEEESGSDEEESGDEEGDEEEEADSSMEDFINDGEISEVEDEDEVAIDEDDSTPRPAKKKSKHR